MIDSATSLRGIAICVVLACITAGIFPACSEDATEANAIVSPVPLKDYTFRDTLIYADTTSSFRQNIPMNGYLNLVGVYGKYQAALVIQFTPAYLPIRDTALVYRATLRLKAASWFGDSSGTLSLNVYPVTRSWNPGTLTWDTLQSGLYDQSIVRGTFTGGAMGDSAWISILLDTAMVRQWLTSSGTSTNYGIVLVPNANSGIVRGFHQYSADTLSPILEIVAGSPAGAPLDTANYQVCYDSFAGNIDNLVSNPSRLYVQSGIVYRSTMHFDLSFVPRGAIINSAEMLLDRDPATSLLNRFSGTPEVVAHLLTSGTDNTQYNSTQYETGTLKTGTDNTFSIDLRHEAQLWLRGSNYGVLLAATSYLDLYSLRDSEHSSFDLYTFYSHREQQFPSHRPRLKIIYAYTKR
jgi:hypothetical protein